ncbi:MAG: c-type cytochrome domain-containing protein [Bacteroidota bacterium]
MLDFFGRLHPLILHLPIGFLVLAFLMQIMKKEALKPAIEFTLKWGMIASILAVASGYFLSQEGGYDDQILFWHKWSGIGTSILSAIVYFSFSKNGRYYFPVFVLTILLLFLAGHLGGSLTHGSDFLFEPFQEKEVKPLITNIDEAFVFQDFIKPVFNEKCNSCHNESKKKGSLLMTSEENILKGGKTGALLVAGNVANSLLFERIHMDLSEKKHMPPEGKKQLTADEKQLLEWWVSAGAPFDKKVGEINAPDEIKLILNKYVTPIKEKGVFALDVSPASESTIKKLHNLGFEVNPVAQGSPFLEAAFNKKNKLKKTALKKLKTIDEQLISIDLNGTEMNDDMMGVISDFAHLEKLYLQNTQITDQALRYLKGLDYLQILNLYGNEITDEGLKKIPALPRLRHIYLWQTEVTENGVNTLKNKMPYLNIDRGVSMDIFADATLNPPLIMAEKDIFKDSLEVELKMNFKGASIFYTLDGSQPDSNSIRYADRPILLTSAAEIKAVAQKTGWKNSPPSRRFFPRAKYELDKVNISPGPNPKYKGKGTQTLHDLEKGSINFKDKKWLGFEKSHATISIDLGTKREVSRITVGVLEDTGAYIFSPKGLEVSVSENGNTFKTVSTASYPTAEGPLPPELKNITENFDSVKTRYLKVKVISNLYNPKWHPAPGAPCWIFLDEVLVE